MHLPDGMLDTRTWVASAATSGGFLAYAVAWVRRSLSERKTVLMAVVAALVFALQMLNFPIAPGISGHFAGGAAAAILLGVWPAVIVITAVLIVQALLFADGGITAFGANVLNLAVVGPLVGYAVWRASARWRRSRASTSAWAALAAWVAVVSASLAVAVELWASGRTPLLVAVAALGGWHALVGIGEGTITAGLVAFVTAVRPDLLGDEEGHGSARALVVALAALACFAAAMSFVASANPDALEFVVSGTGFEPRVEPIASPLADYAVPGIGNAGLAGILAGLVGVAVTAALLISAAAAMQVRRAAAHAVNLHEHEHAHGADPAHQHPHHHPEQDHEHAHTMGFERYTYIVSPVHALDPRAKIIAAGALILGIVLAPPSSPLEFALLAAVLAGVTALARVPVTAVLARSALVLPLAATFAVFAPFVPGGWALAWAIVSKAWLSAYVTLLVSATTPIAKLLSGLRRLGLPAVFVSTMTLLYRFTLVLREQLASMRRAVASRAPGLRGRRLVSLYGNLAGGLFVRAYERGERIHAAMLSRGYDGTLPTAEAPALGPADAFLVATTLATVAALVLY